MGTREPISKIPADNGNTYTVMISDDGMFSAEYVVPAALSIPLGSSGSAVDVVKDEDGTYLVMIAGEYQTITAETMVTAANGNVYRAILSPEGVPVGVMHVAAMQPVMLGDLGGTITLTQKRTCPGRWAKWPSRTATCTCTRTATCTC